MPEQNTTPVEQVREHFSRAQALSLPFTAYTEPDIYALERERIFHRNWVQVCAAQQVSSPGDYCAFHLAGEAVVIIRGKDHTLRAMSNNCRHRGTLLLDDGFGTASRIVCPYHAWSYDDQGRFMRAPYTQEHEIAQDQHHLPQFAVEEWHGLVFVNLDHNADPLSPTLEGIVPYLQLFEVDKLKLIPDTTQEYWHANWKLAMENAMESYHLFKVHRETLEKYTPTKDAFYIEGNANWTVTAGKMQDDRGALRKWMEGDNGIYQYYILISIPPSFVGILYYGSLAWINILPVRVGECVINAAELASPEGAAISDGSQDFVAAFFAEDKTICERVYKGMTSRYGKGGTLTEKEWVVSDFHQYLANRLFDRPLSPHQRSEAADLFAVQ